jgi:hypothetical protein
MVFDQPTLSGCPVNPPRSSSSSRKGLVLLGLDDHALQDPAELQNLVGQLAAGEGSGTGGAWHESLLGTVALR